MDKGNQISNVLESLNLAVLQAKGSFKESDLETSDIISNLSFNQDGSLLAVGDKGGRVVVLARNHCKKNQNNELYYTYSTFHSHEPDFDYLKSVEIEERINKICWIPKRYRSNFILTTNDKTIKLFRINDNRAHKEQSFSDIENKYGNVISKKSVEEWEPNGLHIKREPSFYSSPVRNEKCLRVFSNAHHYNINSISASAGQEYFISSDDLRINLWSISRNDTCFTVVDTKPEKIELLSEVITTSLYHPVEPDIFFYTTSRGCIRLCDTRICAICDEPSLVFEDLKDCTVPQFSEALISISSMAFASNSRYFLTRNYLDIDIWDSNMNTKPIETYKVNDYLNTRETLMDLFERDCLFDKFDACFSRNDNSVLTGTYGNYFSVSSRDPNLQNSPSIFYSTDLRVLKSRNEQHVLIPRIITKSTAHDSNNIILTRPESVDLDKKITTLACHPSDAITALAVNDNLLIVDFIKGRLKVCCC